MNVKDSTLNSLRGSKTIICGSREYIKGDVCFASLDDRIDEMLEEKYNDIHYLIRMVDGVDYDRFMKEIQEVYRCFDIQYEERKLATDGDCLIVEITLKWDMPYRFLYSVLNVMFCTFRCVDYEFRTFYKGREKRDMGLYEAVEFYLKKKDGDTNHCLNENLAALYDSPVLQSALKVFFNTIRLAVSEPVTDDIMESPEIRSYTERRYLRGQTPCYDLLEKIVDYTKRGATHVSFTTV